nr:cyanophycin synthetase [Planococcus glaciei]
MELHGFWGFPKKSFWIPFHISRGVEGRFEVSKLTNGSTVVVDYAHTPDAVSYCLETVKLQGAKRIIHVFGFRGDRDPSKRSAMLSISAEWSDRYI